MKKITKKALEETFKNDYLVSNDFLGIITKKIHDGKTYYYVIFKEYQLTLYADSWGLSGWFDGSITLIRAHRVIELVEGFNND